MQKTWEFQKNIFFCFIDWKPLTVWITTNWKILKEIGIPDHFTCLLRILYLGQESNRSLHRTTDWLKIGKGVWQSGIPAYLTSIQSCCLVTKSCPTLCDPLDYSLPISSLHGILQARILECVAIYFSRGSSQPRDWIHVSYIAGIFFTTESLGKPICRVHHVKCWAGWITSWNQDCWEK